MAKFVRNIVKIDEELCDGCGECVPSCAEGAIQIIDGKARLVADNLCDGLGDCLGTCPQGAITVEPREAESFDEAAVKAHLKATAEDSGAGATKPAQAPQAQIHAGGGCPGSAMRKLAMTGSATDAPTSQTATTPSRLGHWPVQLHLLPVAGDIWNDADLLVAADCVPFAMPDFHERLLNGKTVAVGCPKLDDISQYVEKLTTIFANNNIKSVTVAHMIVPCCTGIVMAVKQALAASGKKDMKLRDLVIDVTGSVVQDAVAAL